MALTTLISFSISSLPRLPHILLINTSFKNQRYPVFSVAFPGQMTYVISDPNLIPVAQKAKTFSFQVIVRQIEQKYMGTSDAIAKLMIPVSEGPGGTQESSYTRDRLASMHKPLQPGPELNKINSAVLKCAVEYINTIGSEWEEKNTWLWMRDLLTSASSRGTFGKAFPVADNPKLIQALWYVEKVPSLYI